MSIPQHPELQPYGQQPPQYYQPAPQRSVAGTTLKVLLTIGAVIVGLVVLAIIAVVAILQLT